MLGVASLSLLLVWDNDRPVGLSKVEPLSPARRGALEREFAALEEELSEYPASSSEAEHLDHEIEKHRLQSIRHPTEAERALLQEILEFQEEWYGRAGEIVERMREIDRCLGGADSE